MSNCRPGSRRTVAQRPARGARATGSGPAWRWAPAAISLAMLVACTEDPGNRAPGARSPVSASWEAAQNDYVAPGWTSGDARGWEEHLRKRAQSQNEYTRVSP